MIFNSSLDSTGTHTELLGIEVNLLFRNEGVSHLWSKLEHRVGKL